MTLGTAKDAVLHDRRWHRTHAASIMLALPFLSRGVSLLLGASSRSLSQIRAARAAFPVPQCEPAPHVRLPSPGSVLPAPGEGLPAVRDFLLGGARFLPAGS